LEIIIKIFHIKLSSVNSSALLKLSAWRSISRRFF
jgi:hypothetical protein